jgi:hypothetical protein
MHKECHLQIYILQLHYHILLKNLLPNDDTFSGSFFGRNGFKWSEDSGIWCREIWYVYINISEKHTSLSLYIEEDVVFNPKNVNLDLSD